jgi:hypothetical protein
MNTAVVVAVLSGRSAAAIRRYQVTRIALQRGGLVELGGIETNRPAGDVDQVELEQLGDADPHDDRGLWGTSSVGVITQHSRWNRENPKRTLLNVRPYMV